MPYFGASDKEFKEYIIHLERNSVEYLIDHYNESQLIIDGEGANWFKRWWFTYTDIEKKAHLDRDIDKYFDRETPINELLVVEPMAPGWEQRIFEGCRAGTPADDDDY